MGLLDTILYLFRRPRKKPSQLSEEAKLRFGKLQNDIGAFDYDEGGFSYPFESGTSLIRWPDVNRIIGYKLDLFTTDEICIELHVGDRAIRFSESTPGWYQFVARLQKVFPTIPKGWDMDIMVPPFATNYTVLFEREGGDLPAMFNFYGSIRQTDLSAVCAAFQKQGWTLRKSGWHEMEARNSWSEISIMKDGKGVLLNGRVVFRPTAAEDIDRVLYSLGNPYQYEFYDEDKNPLRERHWP